MNQENIDKKGNIFNFSFINRRFTTFYISLLFILIGLILTLINTEGVENYKFISYFFLGLGILFIVFFIITLSLNERDEKNSTNEIENNNCEIENNINVIPNGVHVQMNEPFNYFYDSVYRLNSHVDLLGKRAQTNLIWGVFFGLIFLGWGIFLVYNLYSQSNWQITDLKLFSNISLFVFTTLICFFFLNNYKSQLNLIKHYQNEITNIEMKKIALFYAMNTDKDKINEIVLNELAKVERNFILKEKESTIYLKNEEFMHEKNKFVMDILSKFIPTKPIN